MPVGICMQTSDTKLSTAGDAEANLEEQRLAALQIAKAGDPWQAHELLREIVAGWESIESPDYVMRMQALRALGSVLCSLQRGYEAERLHRAALQVRQRHLLCVVKFTPEMAIF